MKKSRSEKEIVDTIRKLPQKHKLSPESRERILTALRNDFYEQSHTRSVRNRRINKPSRMKRWKAPLVSVLAMGLVIVIGFTLWKSTIVPAPPSSHTSASKSTHSANKTTTINQTLSAPVPKKASDPAQVKPKTQDRKPGYSLNKLTSDISAIKMVNAQVGWLQAGNQVLYTQDGGKSWQDVTPKVLATQKSQTSAQYKAEFLDPKNAWVVMTSDKGTIVYHTQDGGSSWKQTPINNQGMASGPITLTFNSASDGWLLLANGAGAGSELVSLFHTRDGGTTWESVGATQPNANQKDPLPMGGMKSGLSVNPPDVWLTGLDASDVPYLYRSEDMGVHWQQQKSIQVPNGGYTASGGASETYPPKFFNQSFGILPVKYNSQDPTFVYAYFFYLTQDGGKTWQAGTGVKSKTNAEPLYQIIDDHHIAVVMDTNTLYMSSDQGQSWQMTSLKMPLDNINFINPTTGFGYHGKSVYRTVDGGKTWTLIAS